MFKKFLLTTFVFSMMQSAFAGLYVGAGAGVNQGSWDMRDVAGNKVHFGKRMPIGTLFGGYNSMFNANVALGGEVFASLSNVNGPTKSFVTDAGPTSVYIKQSYQYGFSLLPGVVIAQGALLYLRAGILRSHFAINANNSIYDETRNLAGKQLGAGIDYAWASNMNVRLEYDYNKFISMQALDSTFTPHNNQLMLAVVYRSS